MSQCSRGLGGVWESHKSKVNFERHRCEITEAQIRDARILASRHYASVISHLRSSKLPFFN
jgi:hypothetical protein